MRKQQLHPLTAVINEKQKNLSKKLRQDALNWLVKRFPEAFDNTQRVRPLEIGIMQQILSFAEEAHAEGISKSKLREAVVRHTRKLEYLACLKAREPRIDLYGNLGDLVSNEDAERAAQKIKQRVEKNIKSISKSATPSAPKLQKAPRASTSIAKPEAPMYSPSNNADGPIAYNMQNNFSHTSRTQPVTIKHKQTRQYDPEAVARLKEKLGISRKKKEST